jgi:hypothetical protein
MGKLTLMRNFLYNLFSKKPGVFRRHLTDDDIKSFCLIVIDMMGFLAGKVKHEKKKKKEQTSESSPEEEETFHALNVAQYMRDIALSYMHNNEYTCTKGLVLLLDSVIHVPKSKAKTQQKRDTTDVEEKNDEAKQDHKPKKEPIILNEELYNTYTSRVDMEELNHLLINEHFEGQLPRDLVWRSGILNTQLRAVITKELASMPIRNGIKVVFDDGILISDEKYRNTRESIIRDYGFENRSEFEKDCLTSCLAQQYFTQIFTFIGGKDPVRLPSTSLGEADIKFPRFILPPSKGTQTRKTIVVTTDTDAIITLLLHWKTMQDEADDVELWIDTQRPADRIFGVSKPYRFINIKALYSAIIELFKEEYPTVVNPIETFVFLVCALETDFTDDFGTALRITPKVVWDTFSELHAAKLTTNEADGTVKRTRAETFIRYNAAMYDEQYPTKSSLKDKDKMGVIIRSKPGESVLPREFHDILSDAVQYKYDAKTDFYNITLDDFKCQRFLYLLCQFRVIDDLAALGNKEYDKKKLAYRKFITNRDELFALATFVVEETEKHKNAKDTNTAIDAMLESKKRKALSDLGDRIEKKKQQRIGPLEQPPQAKPVNFLTTKPQNGKAVFNELLDDIEVEVKETKPPSPSFNQWISSVKSKTLETKAEPILLYSSSSKEEMEEEDEIEEMEEENETKKPSAFEPPRFTNKKHLDTLVKRGMPPMYGIPPLNGMLARIYREEFLLNYYQNGWKEPRYKSKIFECDRVNTNLSKYGWKAREIQQNDESIKRGDFNNNYYAAFFKEGVEKGRIPYYLYEIEETDDICNRNPQLYSQGY